MISSKSLSNSEKAQAIIIEAKYDGEFELPLTNKQSRFDLIEIRVKTADSSPTTAIIKPVIITDDIEQFRGIIEPNVPAIIDLIRIYFSGKEAEELRDFDKSIIPLPLIFVAPSTKTPSELSLKSPAV